MLQYIYRNEDGHIYIKTNKQQSSFQIIAPNLLPIYIYIYLLVNLDRFGVYFFEQI